MWSKKHWFEISLALIFLVSLLTRFASITTIPPVFSHDEVYYVTEAKSLSLSGKGLDGQWTPFLLTSSHSLYAELPGLVMSIGALVFPSSPLLAARFVHVILGSLLTLVLGGLMWRLFKNKELTLITALVVAINPWMFQMSRMNFDSLLSIFFLSLGAYLLLSRKKLTSLASMIPFFIGFFQYQGHKLVFVPFVLLVVSYQLLKNKDKTLVATIKRNWPGVMVLGLSVLLFLSFAIRISSQPAASRTDDLIVTDIERLSAHATKERLLSLPTPLNKFRSNKATALVQIVSEKYLGNFNPILLFLKGEPFRNPTSLWSMGIFYPFDLVFLAVGIASLFAKKKYRLEWLLLLGLVLIGPLPSALNNKENWLFLRSSFMFPFLLTFISYGLYHLWNTKSKKSVVRILISLTLAISATMLGYEYFVRYPVYASREPFWGERVVSSYVFRSNEAQNKPVLVLADEAWFVFNSYLAYSNRIDKTSLPAVNKAMREEDFRLKEVVVKTDCFKAKDLENFSAVVMDNTTMPCDEDAEELLETQSKTDIKALATGTVVYKVINDKLCQPFLTSLPPSVTRDTLNIETLNNQQFCATFLSPD